MRAITSGKDPHFMLTNKGIGYFAEATTRIEARLPPYLRPSFNGGRPATGHTGRHTAATTAMNAPGAEASTVQRMTHHKSADQLAGYVEAQQAMLLAGPLSILEAVGPAPSLKMASEAQSNSMSHSSNGTHGSSSSSADSVAPCSPAKTGEQGVHTRTRSSPSPDPKKARHAVKTGGNTYYVTFN